MGSLSQRLENPFQAHGLRPGSTLVLEFAVDGLIETHVTVLDEVGDDLIAVLRPLVKLEPRPLPVGVGVQASWQTGGKHYFFHCEVRHNSPVADVDFLTRPSAISQGDRRGEYRLQTALRPIELFRLVVDGRDGQDLARNSTIVDLSEGGLCLSSRTRLEIDERIGLRLELAGQGTLTARAIVRSTQPPPSGFRNWRMHCQFVGLGSAARAMITRYLISRQLELGRKGQL